MKDKKRVDCKRTKVKRPGVRSKLPLAKRLSWVEQELSEVNKVKLVKKSAKVNKTNKTNKNEINKTNVSNNSNNFILNKIEKKSSFIKYGLIGIFLCLMVLSFIFVINSSEQNFLTGAVIGILPIDDVFNLSINESVGELINDTLEFNETEVINDSVEINETFDPIIDNTIDEEIKDNNENITENNTTELVNDSFSEELDETNDESNNEIDNDKEEELEKDETIPNNETIADEELEPELQENQTEEINQSKESNQEEQAMGLMMDIGIMATPSVSNLVLNTSGGLNSTYENLTAYWTTSDGDSDPVKNITNWKVDGSPIAILNMPFENNTVNISNTTKDYSGYGNNGTVINATWNSTGGYDGYGAYEFDGTSSYITGNSSTIDGDFGTICAWIKLNSIGTTQYGISSADESSTTRFISLLRVDNANYRASIYQDNNDADDWVEGSTALSADQWYHVCTQSNGTGYRIFVNGTEETLTVRSGSNNGDWFSDTSARDNLVIGALKRTSVAVYFNGTIDEVMIFNRTLSAEQISALYNNRTDLIVSQETSIGDNWSIEVTPNDGTSDGTTQISNNLTILASCPDVSGTWVVSSNYTLNENISCTNIIVNNSATLIVNGAYIITTTNLTIDSNSEISANERGCTSSQSPDSSNVCSDQGTGAGYGEGRNGDYADGAGGGGYGGDGGTGNTGYSGGYIYASTLRPSLKGSGGGGNNGEDNGGSGGGAIRISVSDTFVLNGTVSSTGGNGGTFSGGWYNSGGGSGGSIFVDTNILSGSGNFSANGGNGDNTGAFASGGGSGGRIAVYFNQSTLSNMVTSSVSGGSGPGDATDGESGTLVFVDLDDNNAWIDEGMEFNASDYYSEGTFKPTANDQFNFNSLTILSSTRINSEVNVTTSVLNITDGTITCDSFNGTENFGFKINTSATGIYDLSTATFNITTLYRGSSLTFSSCNQINIYENTTGTQLFTNLALTTSDNLLLNNPLLVNMNNYNVSVGANFTLITPPLLNISDTTISVTDNFNISDTTTTFSFTNSDIDVTDDLFFPTLTTLDFVNSDIVAETAYPSSSISLVQFTNSNLTSNFNLTTTNLTIDSNSEISADEKGCPSTQSPNTTSGGCSSQGGGAGYGEGRNGDYADGAGGGGYGGAGGNGESGYSGGYSYGSTLRPILKGSGGGGGNGESTYAGGSGGGVILLFVSDTFVLNGTISSTGGNGGSFGSGWYNSGGGSGGSIFVETNNLTGSGDFSATGGNGIGSGIVVSGGGSGGRIAVYFNQSTLSNMSASTVAGGSGPEDATDGEVGTLFFADLDDNNAWIDEGMEFNSTDYSDYGTLKSTANSNFTFANLTSLSSPTIRFKGNNILKTEIINFTSSTIDGNNSRIDLRYSNNLFDSGAIYNNLYLSLEKTNISRIDFLTNLTNIANLSLNTNLSSNRVFVNSANEAGLNVSANITLYNLSLSGVDIAYDLDDDGTFTICPADTCTELSYSGGTALFNVTHFTTYKAVIPAICDYTISSCNSSGWAANSTVCLDSNIVDNDSTCMAIDASNVILDCQGNTIDGDDLNTDYGVYVSAQTNVTVRNCIIKDFADGIQVLSSSHNFTLENSTVTSNEDDGIVITSSNSPTIINSTISDNTDNGIELTTSNNGYFYNSTYSGHSGGSDVGLYVISGVNNINVSNNNFTSNYWGILYSPNIPTRNTFISNIFTSNTQTGMELLSGDNAVIRNNKFFGNKWGIRIGNNDADDNEFYDNQINTSTTVAISFASTSTFDQNFSGNTVNGQLYYHCNGNNSVSANDIFINDTKVTSYGSVIISNCNDSTFTNVTVANNGVNGIYVYSSNNVTIANSSFSDMVGDGVVIDTSTNVTLSNSSVTSNGDEGIILTSSDGFIVQNSNISSNTDNGVEITTSDNGLFYSNTFSGHSGGSDVSLYLISGNYVNVSDNNFTSNYWGILYGTANGVGNIFENNVFTSNSDAGIDFNAGDNAIIRNNIFLGNKWGVLFGATTADNNSFYDNQFNTSTTSAIKFSGTDMNHTFIDNTVNGEIYYHCNGNNSWSVSNVHVNGTKFTDLGALNIYNCDNATLYNVTVVDHDQDGIYLYDSHNVTISDSNISNNEDGIIIDESHNVTIRHSTISGNTDDGIFTDDSNGGLIYNNSILNHDGATDIGLYVYDSTNYLNVSYNNFSGNDIGIIYDARTDVGNTFTRNTFSGGDECFFFALGSNAIIAENIFDLCDHSIWFNNAGATANLIYHNNFLNRTTEHARTIDTDDHFNSTGIFSLGGNYWDDYATVMGFACVDQNNDGFCDSPYNTTNVVDQDMWPFVEEVIFGNVAPNTTQVILNATSINNYTTDDLTCYANVTDLNRENISVNFTWYRNGILNITGQSDNFSWRQIYNVANLSSSNTTKGENWTCSVIAYDNKVYEGNWTNASITILNSPPNTNQIIINSTYLTNYTNENITCYANITDADLNETLFANYSWYRNGTLNFSGQQTAIAEGNFSLISTLTSSNITRGDNWTCNVQAYDNELYEDGGNNASILVQPIGCGFVDSNITLTRDVSSEGTCFMINAHEVVLDCAGYNVNYASGSGDGNGYGVNNSGFHNVTIKNCLLNEGNSATNLTHALFFNNASRGTIYNNTITMVGKHSYGASLNASPFMNFTNNSLLSSAQYAHGIIFNASSNSTFNKNIITTSTYYGYAVQFSSTSNSNITNNIITTSGSSTNYGFFADKNSTSNNLTANNITTNANGGWGIRLSPNCGFNTIYKNIVDTNGYNGHALYLQAGTNNIKRNIINNSGDSADGIWLLSGHSNNISKNNITISGDNRGIIFTGGNDFNIVKDNQIKSNTGRGISIGNGCNKNIFLNNNISSTDTDYIFSDTSGNSATNTLIYNNSYGQVNWTSLDLDVNITLEVGKTIYLEDNLVGLTDDARSLNLNNFAEIEIRNLSYTTTPYLLKNGTRCDQTTDCNISYDNSSGIVYANVSGFSNYTTQASVAPNVTVPTISPLIAYTNYTLTANTTYTDANDDNGTIYFRWYVNGINVYNQTNVSVTNGTIIITTLGPNNFSKNDLVNVSVYANDSIFNSTLQWSNTIVIQNLIPLTPSVNLTSTDSLNRTNGTLTSSWSFSDGDNDLEQGNDTRWYKNSSEVSSLQNLTSINSANTSKGENWTFSVKVFDGQVWSAWVNSSVLTIRNTLPKFNESLTNQIVNSSQIFTYDINCSDLDNELLTYYDNSSLFKINSSTGLINYTPGDNQTGTHIINISCSDGEVNVSQSFNYTIIDLTPPTVTLIEPTDGSRTTNPQVTFTCSATDGVALTNLTFYFWNTLGNLSTNFTSISGTSNSSEWTLNLPSYGTYIWNCLANDSNNNSAFAASNSTVVYSAVVEEAAPPSTGGGGGSAITPDYECVTQNDCAIDEYCIDHECMKIFDLKIIRLDSPIQPGEFLDFTYFVKGMADISGDVWMDFWVEQDGQIISSGSDVIFVGNFEEKLESTNLFLPTNTEMGNYELYVRLRFESYIISSYRLFEVKQEVPLLMSLDILDLPSIAPDSAWNYTAILAVNKDELLSATVERRIIQNENVVWFKQGELIINRSNILTDEIRDLAAGHYQLELVAAVDELTAKAEQSFTVGEVEGLPALESRRESDAFYGHAIGDTTAVLDDYTLLWIIFIIIVILTVATFYIFRSWKKKRGFPVGKKLTKEKSVKNYDALEHWVRMVLEKGISQKELQELAFEHGGWKEQDLLLVQERIKITEELEKSGLSKKKIKELHSFVRKQALQHTSPQQVVNTLVQTGWSKKLVSSFVKAYYQ